MLKYLRYALATLCFAASVGCLALWWRGNARRVYFPMPAKLGNVQGLFLEAWAGTGVISLASEHLFSSFSGRKAIGDDELRASILEHRIRQSRLGHFGRYGKAIHFPLWYPALVFALAGIATLSLGHRFTLRSALIATTVVAGLLGVAAGM